MILAGRRINDGMAAYVAQDLIKTMLKRKLRVDAARVLVLGFTFKENVPDTRNTKIADLVAELSSYVAKVEIYDPMADAAEARHEYGLTIDNALPAGPFDALVLAVKHDAIVALCRDGLGKLLGPGGVVYDIKGLVPPGDSHARL